MKKLICVMLVLLSVFEIGYNIGVKTGNNQVLKEQIIKKEGPGYKTTWNGKEYKYVQS